MATDPVCPAQSIRLKQTTTKNPHTSNNNNNKKQQQQNKDELIYILIFKQSFYPSCSIKVFANLSLHLVGEHPRPKDTRARAHTHTYTHTHTHTHTHTQSMQYLHKAINYFII